MQTRIILFLKYRRKVGCNHFNINYYTRDTMYFIYRKINDRSSQKVLYLASVYLRLGGENL